MFLANLRREVSLPVDALLMEPLREVVTPFSWMVEMKSLAGLGILLFAN